MFVVWFEYAPAFGAEIDILILKNQVFFEYEIVFRNTLWHLVGV